MRSTCLQAAKTDDVTAARKFLVVIFALGDRCCVYMYILFGSWLLESPLFVWFILGSLLLLVHFILTLVIFDSLTIYSCSILLLQELVR